MEYNSPAPELTARVKVKAKVRDRDRVRVRFRVRVWVKVKVSFNNNNFSAGEVTDKYRSPVFLNRIVSHALSALRRVLQFEGILLTV